MISLKAQFSALDNKVFAVSKRTVKEAREAIVSACDAVGGDVLVAWDNGHVERFDGIEWFTVEGAA